MLIEKVYGVLPLLAWQNHCQPEVVSQSINKEIEMLGTSTTVNTKYIP